MNKNTEKKVGLNLTKGCYVKEQLKQTFKDNKEISGQELILYYIN